MEGGGSLLLRGAIVTRRVSRKTWHGILIVLFTNQLRKVGLKRGLKRHGNLHFIPARNKKLREGTHDRRHGPEMFVFQLLEAFLLEAICNLPRI